MLWLMVYITVAVVMLSVVGARYAKALSHDRRRVAVLVVAAALWPAVVLGLAQFGAVQLCAKVLRRHTPAPVEPAASEAEPPTTPMVLLDH